MARRIVAGDESDAHSRWRHLLKSFQRPGVAKKTKKRTNKRERREADWEIEDQLDEENENDGRSISE